MRRRLVLGWFGVGFLTLLAACGSESERGLSPEEWATVSAYQQEVVRLETQVAALFTAIPTEAPATPTVPIASAWNVAISGVTRATSYPNYATESDAPLTLEARGVFLAIRLDVVNAGLQPVEQFPWWTLRLHDGAGRTFTPQENATASYVVAEAGIVKPEEYQPGVVYDEAVVFDVPPEARDFTLRSADGTLSLNLPATGAVGTPSS